MPSIQWEWRIGPQTIISGLNLLVMLIGLVSIFTTLEADVHLAKDQVTELRGAVTTLASSQQQQAVDAASVKAKVDLMLPMVEKIGDQLARIPRSPQP